MTRLTLARLLNKHHLNAVHISQESNVLLNAVRSMLMRLQHQPPEPTKRRVLHVFNQLAGTNYHYDEVDL